MYSFQSYQEEGGAQLFCFVDNTSTTYLWDWSREGKEWLTKWPPVEAMHRAVVFCTEQRRWAPWQDSHTVVKNQGKRENVQPRREVFKGGHTLPCTYTKVKSQNKTQTRLTCANVWPASRMSKICQPLSDEGERTQGHDEALSQWHHSNSYIEARKITARKDASDQQDYLPVWAWLVANQLNKSGRPAIKAKYSQS